MGNQVTWPLADQTLHGVRAYEALHGARADQARQGLRRSGAAMAHADQTLRLLQWLIRISLWATSASLGDVCAIGRRRAASATSVPSGDID